MSNIGRGIPISVGFDLGADMPLDARSTVEKKSDLNTLVEEGIACHGLTVFVLEDETYYQYLGNKTWEEIGRLGKVQTLINVTANTIRTEVKDLENNTNTKIEQAANAIRSEVNDVNNGLSSKIEQTANAIRSEISNTNNDLSSNITQTSESITSKVENLEAGLNSKIEQTAGAIRSEVSDTANELNSKIEQTAEAMRSEVNNTVNGLNSKIEQTANAIRTEVKTADDNLNSLIEQTATQIRAEIKNTNDGLNSKITQTANAIRAEVTDSVNGLDSKITQTADAIRSEITNSNNETNSSIEQTATQIRAEVKTADDKLASSITQTAAQIRTEVKNADDKLASSIIQTASEINTKVSSLDNRLTSSINQTATSLTTQINDFYTSLSSSITQTAGEIRAEVADKEKNLNSKITQTASEIRSEIANTDKNLTSTITQTAALLRVEIEDLEKDCINIIETKSDLFRVEIKDNKEQLESKIEQTANEIRLEVANIEKNLNSKITQTAEAIRSEVTDANNATNSRITQTANAIRQELTDVNNGLSSRITQTVQDLTVMFQDGYEFGITRVNKDGIRVMHSGYDGYTEMKSTGFYVNDGKEDVVSITKDGSTFKGKVYMNGGQVPSDYITGKLKAGQIDADAITATHIKAGAINADKIATGAITSNKLSADAITGKTITGGTITGTTINNGNGTFSVDANGNLIAKNASLSGSITGATFSSNNDEFMVLEDGTVKSQSLVIEDLITTRTLNVDEINNPWYPQCLYEATKVYIDEHATDEQVSKMWQNEGVYQSITQMLSYAPRNLGGYTLTINLQSNINDNIALSWFHSGQVNIEFNGHTVYGYVYGYGASMVYRLYGQFNGQSADSDPGFVMPYKGRASGSYTYGIYFQYCQFAINNLSVYPDKVNGTMSGGVYADRGARGCIFKVNAMGDMRYLVRADYGSHVYVSKSTGRCNNATFCASTGGIICLNSNESQAGTTGTNPYWAGSGGSILTDQVLGMNKITFDNASNGGTNNNPGINTGETVTVTETVKATSADTYRSTVYNNWKGDGTCRQGDYGYGDCQGCWFFGNNLYNTMNAGTVSKVVIRIKRQSGGVAALQTMTVKSHNHTSKPSGAPTYTNTIGTCSCAVGSYIDLIITDTATINKLKACKGLGLSIGSASSPYIVCSGNCQVIVTYKKTLVGD